MKSFFSKLGTTNPSKKSSPQPTPQVSEMLAKAEDLLRQLGTQQGGDLPWHLINEATRTVQLLEGSVSKMVDSDMKVVWRAQVDELQKRLQEATQMMLGGGTPATNNTPGDPSGGGSLFSGLEVGGTPSGTPRVGGDLSQPGDPFAEQALTLPGDSQPLDGGGGGLFSGLDLLEPTSGGTTARTQGSSTQDEGLLGGLDIAGDPSVPSGEQPSHVPTGVAGGPLPEDLFSMLDDLTAVSSSAPITVNGGDPAGAPAPGQGDPGDVSQGLHASAEGGEGRPPSFLPPPTLSRASGTLPTSTAGMVVPESPMSARSSDSRGDASHPFASAPAGTVPESSGVRASAGGGRKKKITRRVGYARDADEEAPEEKAPAPQPRARAAASASLLQGMELTASEPVSIPPPALSYDLPPTGAAHMTPVDTDQVDLLLSLGDSLAHSPAQPPIFQPRAAVPSNPTTSPPSYGLPTSGLPPNPTTSAPPYSLPTSGSSYGLPTTSPLVPAADGRPQYLPQPPLRTPLESVLQATEGLGFEARIQAVQDATSDAINSLAARLAGALEEDRAAKEKRRDLVAQLTVCRGELAELEAAEARAVEAEDFDAAASLSSKLDQLKAKTGNLERDVHVTEGACQLAVNKRAELAEQQAGIWREAAASLQKLRDAQEAAAAHVAETAAVAAKEAEAAQAAGAEHVEELAQRISVRQRWLEGEEEALNAKLDEATRPIAGTRSAAADTHASLLKEVEALRAALAEKEAALEAAASELNAVETQMKTLCAKYDKMRQVLEEDRQQLGTQVAERDAEVASLAKMAASAAASREASEQEAANLRTQAEAARKAAEAMAAQAEAVEARASKEQRYRELHARLRAAADAAGAEVLELEGGFERERAEGQNLISRRAALLHEARAHSESAAAASRRVPELEVEKKAAAAARDFKEAGRLAEQAKALLAQAEAAAAKAAEFRADAARLEAQEASASAHMAEFESRLLAARRASALARWRCLQASLKEMREQQDAAASEERFAEAELLESEIAATSAEAATIASAHGFTPADLGDLLQLPETSPKPSSSAAALPTLPGPSAEDPGVSAALSTLPRASPEASTAPKTSAEHPSTPLGASTETPLPHQTLPGGAGPGGLLTTGTPHAPGALPGGAGAEGLLTPGAPQAPGGVEQRGDATNGNVTGNPIGGGGSREGSSGLPGDAAEPVVSGSAELAPGEPDQDAQATLEGLTLAGGNAGEPDQDAPKTLEGLTLGGGNPGEPNQDTAAVFEGLTLAGGNAGEPNQDATAVFEGLTLAGGNVGEPNQDASKTLEGSTLVGGNAGEPNQDAARVFEGLTVAGGNVSGPGSDLAEAVDSGDGGQYADVESVTALSRQHTGSWAGSLSEGSAGVQTPKAIAVGHVRRDTSSVSEGSEADGFLDAGLEARSARQNGSTHSRSLSAASLTSSDASTAASRPLSTSLTTGTSIAPFKRAGLSVESPRNSLQRDMSKGPQGTSEVAGTTTGVDGGGLVVDEGFGEVSEGFGEVSEGFGEVSEGFGEVSHGEVEIVGKGNEGNGGFYELQASGLGGDGVGVGPVSGGGISKGVDPVLGGGEAAEGLGEGSGGGGDLFAGLSFA